MRERLTPLQKEWAKLEKQETAYLTSRMEKMESKMTPFLEKKIPLNLQNTLNAAFSKAFYIVFEKGTGVIEKTYKKEELQKTYQINEYAEKLCGNRKSLKTFSKKALGSANVNLLFSGVSGIGLGVLGIGIPDIVLFTGLMLKSVYEIALSYGFDYQDESEKHFVLLLIQGAFSYGNDLEKINSEVNFYIENGNFYKEMNMDSCIDETASCLSGELLYMKFLQGIPVVGVAGGVYDAIYMKQVVKYAELKYRRRFYEKKRKAEHSCF